MVDFFPLLLGALGSLAAPVLGSLFGKELQADAQQTVPRGKGLQVDAQQRAYRRVPRVKKKKKTFAINQCPVGKRTKDKKNLMVFLKRTSASGRIIAE